MKIGLIDVDRTNFPNLALMKISAYHKAQGHDVEFYNAFTDTYDVVYKSKIFTFTQDFNEYINAHQVLEGGTGYSLRLTLPEDIDRIQPDYDLYRVDKKTAYGFLTRGCPNKCKWCVVPLKEGNVHPYMDVEEIAVDGRKNLILMDNNILASEYGLKQIEKIISKGYRVDFNQALDARLINEEKAQLLGKVKWLTAIRLGCDTMQQISECEKAMQLIDKYRGKPAQYLLYSMINQDIHEAYERLSHFRNNKRVRIVAQPYRDFTNTKQIIPQWQKDMARWAMRREIYATCDFKDYKPRLDFVCSKYFNQ